jgi:hypothetical protein
MKIIEQLVESKTGRPETCEDAIFVNEHFVAIIDGATNKTTKLWNGRTSGQIAKDCILEALPHIQADAAPEKFFLTCNESIKNWYDKNSVTIEMQYHINQRCTASMILYNKYTNQVWGVGSGQAIIGKEHVNNTKLGDDLLSELRAFFIATEIKNGRTEAELIQDDTGRELIRPLLLRQMLFQNSNEQSEWNFYELDGFFTGTHGIYIYDIPEGINEIILASDGYPEVLGSLEQTEAFLKQLLNEDPLCYKKYKATKGLRPGNVSFDDRSYVKISL